MARMPPETRASHHSFMQQMGWSAPPSSLVGFLKDPRVILSRIRFLFGRQIGKVEVFTNLSNSKEAAGVSPGSFVREAWAMFLRLYLPPRPNGPKAQR